MTDRKNADLKVVVDQLEAVLPERDEPAAHLALAFAASKCIDAGLTEAEAGQGLAAQLKGLRALMSRTERLQ